MQFLFETWCTSARFSINVLCILLFALCWHFADKYLDGWNCTKAKNVLLFFHCVDVKICGSSVRFIYLCILFSSLGTVMSCGHFHSYSFSIFLSRYSLPAVLSINSHRCDSDSAKNPLRLLRQLPVTATIIATLSQVLHYLHVTYYYF